MTDLELEGLIYRPPKTLKDFMSKRRTIQSEALCKNDLNEKRTELVVGVRSGESLLS
jgi:hypothetical protein